jgi:hypothetical protein
MAPSLYTQAITVLIITVLFYVLTPGVFLEIPNNSPKPDITDVWVHGLIFALVVVLGYDAVTGYLHKRF